MCKARKILLSKRFCAGWLEGFQNWKMKILRKLQSGTNIMTKQRKSHREEKKEAAKKLKKDTGYSLLNDRTV